MARQEAIVRFGIHEVRRMQEAGRWRALWSGVLLDADRLTDPLALASAAIALGGPGTVLAGPTAAYVHGCRSMDPMPVHLAVPYGHWLRSRPGLVVHKGRHLDADREVRDELPVLSLERVLGDMLCRARPSDALALVDESSTADTRCTAGVRPKMPPAPRTCGVADGSSSSWRPRTSSGPAGSRLRSKRRSGSGAWT